MSEKVVQFLNDVELIEYIESNTEDQTDCKILRFLYGSGEAIYKSLYKKKKSFLDKTLHAFQNVEIVTIFGCVINIEHFGMIAKLPNLKSLSIGGIYINYDSIILNNNLEQLNFTFYKGKVNYSQVQTMLDRLPTNLKTLFIHTEIKLNIDNLPANLEKLIIIGTYPNSIDLLPVTLKELVLSEGSVWMKNTSLTINYLANLPANLEKLLISYYDAPLDNLPHNLQVLKIIKFDYPSVVTLPENIKTFICDYFTNIKHLYLNDNLEVLILGKITDETQVDLSKLPNTIHTLKLSNYFEKFLDKTYQYPLSLKNIYIHHKIYKNKNTTDDDDDDYNTLDLGLLPKTLTNLYVLYYKTPIDCFVDCDDLSDYPRITIKNGSLKIKFMINDSFEYDYLDPDTNYFHF